MESKDSMDTDTGDKSKGTGLGFANLARTVAAKWKSLPPEVKAPFEAEAAKEKAHYNAQMVVWRASQEQEEARKAGRPLQQVPQAQAGTGTAFQSYAAPMGSELQQQQQTEYPESWFQTSEPTPSLSMGVMRGQQEHAFLIQQQLQQMQQMGSMQMQQQHSTGIPDAITNSMPSIMPHMAAHQLMEHQQQLQQRQQQEQQHQQHQHQLQLQRHQQQQQQFQYEHHAMMIEQQALMAQQQAMMNQDSFQTGRISSAFQHTPGRHALGMQLHDKAEEKSELFAKSSTWPAGASRRASAPALELRPDLSPHGRQMNEYRSSMGGLGGRQYSQRQLHGEDPHRMFRSKSFPSASLAPISPTLYSSPEEDTRTSHSVDTQSLAAIAAPLSPMHPPPRLMQSPYSTNTHNILTSPNMVPTPPQQQDSYLIPPRDGLVGQRGRSLSAPPPVFPGDEEFQTAEHGSMQYTRRPMRLQPNPTHRSQSISGMHTGTGGITELQAGHSSQNDNHALLRSTFEEDADVGREDDDPVDFLSNLRFEE